MGGCAGVSDELARNFFWMRESPIYICRKLRQKATDTLFDSGLLGLRLRDNTTNFWPLPDSIAFGEAV